MPLSPLNGSGIKDVFNKIRDLFEISKKSIVPKSIYAIDDTDAVTDINCYAIQAITDTVINTISTKAVNGPWDLTGETISAGTIIYVQFTAIALTSGVCICYEH